MNGAHDMGGNMGFGPVEPEPDEPVFHGRWESRVLAMNIAMGPVAGWNIDQNRFARENVSPLAYLSRSYYEIWFHGLTRLLEERGLLKPEELDAGHKVDTAAPAKSPLSADAVAKLIATGRSAAREVEAQARFQIGDRVRTINEHPGGHTRLPRYVRNHVGVVTHLHGAHVYPDTHAAGAGEHPQWLYTVRFAGPELWGASSDPSVTVSVDTWESYLEPAP